MISRTRNAGNPRWQRLLLIACLCSPAILQAATPGMAEELEVRIGFSGHYKVGYWVPVFVTVPQQARGAGPLAVDVTVPDGDGVSTTTTYTVPSDTVPSDTVSSDDAPAERQRFSVETYCKIGRIDGELTVRVRDGERVVTTRSYSLGDGLPAPLPSDAQLLVAIGAMPNVVKAISKPLSADGNTVQVAEINADQRLPSKWYGYDGVDTVIITSRRPEANQLFEESGTATALIDWIKNGGHLLVSVGTNAERVLGEGTPLADLAPGEFVDVVSMPKLEPLEAYASADDPLYSEDDEGRAQDFEIPFYRPAGGNILLALQSSQHTIPLIHRRIVGFGQITFLALDLERPELGIWNGTRRLVGQLVFSSSTTEDKGKRRVPGELAHVGYDDLSGQLRSALDHFEGQGVRLIPFVVVLMFGVVYMLLVAPSDYFFLRRILGRMEFTWLTFPILIAVTCCGSYFLARLTKGDERLVNQAELVDIDVATGAVRGDVWFTIFSPNTTSYDVSAHCQIPIDESHGVEDQNQQADRGKQDGEVDDILLSWQGLPGLGLGGMRSRAATPQFASGYQYGPQLRTMEDLPIQVWSTKCLRARYRGTCPAPVEAVLNLSPSTGGPLIRGTITNKLQVTLEECTLFHHPWSYELGSIKPGETIKVDRDSSTRTIRNHLSRIGEWSAEDDDQRNNISRIFRRMMFYNLAGGRDATPLKNRYLSNIDMSDLLSAGKAVLIARVESTTFHIDGNQEELTYPSALKAAMYRIVVPVQKQTRQDDFQ